MVILINTKEMTEDILFGVQKQQLNHLSDSESAALKKLCFLSKNMYNVALYNARQHYFSNGKFMSYENNYTLCKNNENYRLMNSNSAQQIIKTVSRNLKSSIAISESNKKSGLKDSQVRLPSYLKPDGFFNLIFSDFNINDGFFTVPMSVEFRHLHGKVRVKIPSNLKNMIIKEIRVLPKLDARLFEIHYVYEVKPSQKLLSKENVLAIDLGIDNLATCVTNAGNAFIVDGKRLKSINAYANRTDTKLQSIKDKQKTKGTTRQQKELWNKRNLEVRDYINKAARIIVNYCIDNDIGVIVIGYNRTFQQNSNIGKVNNQNFVNLPIGQLKRSLSYLCLRYNIELIEQEESYTSKADFLSGDDIPKYEPSSNNNYKFSGRRISRGMYLSGTGVLLNADINGALNILKKSNVAVFTLQSKEYISPKRIKVS